MTRKTTPFQTRVRRGINFIGGTVASALLGTGIFLKIDDLHLSPWMLIVGGVVIGGGLVAFNLMR